ncbi:hypothetical protein E2C01_014139 [Portunus trituberculatus]|uniref:Uncharacterized protein n=1 Tax=Portunus trituberculatus TaxID=210409 RepID=A0A5B7DJ34_PORTR|nr:hypothetical protein [Portunus trituberculatus]
MIKDEYNEYTYNETNNLGLSPQHSPIRQRLHDRACGERPHYPLDHKTFPDVSPSGGQLQLESVASLHHSTEGKYKLLIIKTPTTQHTHIQTDKMTQTTSTTVCYECAILVRQSLASPTLLKTRKLAVEPVKGDEPLPITTTLMRTPVNTPPPLPPSPPPPSPPPLRDALREHDPAVKC